MSSVAEEIPPRDAAPRGANRSRVTARDVALVLHRYVGLGLSVFLILAGATGTVLAFNTQLDAAFNPRLFRAAPPREGAPLLDPIELGERVEAQLPRGQKLRGIILRIKPGENVNYWIDEREVFVDPYTGRIVARRRWGDLGEGFMNVLPFLYRLHYSLALGEVGATLFGVLALVFTVDCFVGAYLTFPRRARATRGGPAWMRRWISAWSLNTSKRFSFIFSWHRASGLWVWAVLLVFAWSAVAINLYEPVYRPVMRTVFGAHADPAESLPDLAAPRTAPALGFREALALGRRLMADEAREQGFRVLHERSIDYDEAKGVYFYTVESTLCLGERLAGTYVAFDGNTGRALAFDAPTKQHAGATFTSYIVALHFGAVREGGLVYRSFVCAMGVVLVLLTASGVWIWWKKRAPRRRPLR